MVIVIYWKPHQPLSDSPPK